MENFQIKRYKHSQKKIARLLGAYRGSFFWLVVVVYIWAWVAIVANAYLAINCFNCQKNNIAGEVVNFKKIIIYIIRNLLLYMMIQSKRQRKRTAYLRIIIDRYVYEY